MKPLLQDFIDRITAALPWLNRRTLGTLAFAVVFIGLMVWLIPPDHPRTRAAVYQAAPTATITPSAVAATEIEATEIVPTQPGKRSPTRTPLPPEYLNNRQQTVGIALIGAFLALIVVVGVLLFMPREER